MKFLTIFELAARSDSELHATYRQIFNELAQSEEDSAERRNALASLKNIKRTLHSRPPRP